MQLYPISGLWQRYGCGKTTLYGYFNNLKIIPIKVDGRKQAYLSQVQLQLLENRHAPIEGMPKLEELEYEEVEDVLVKQLQLPEPPQPQPPQLQEPQEPQQPEQPPESQLIVAETDALVGESVEEIGGEYVSEAEDAFAALTEEDIEDAKHHAQRRAAGLTVVTNLATLHYMTTGAYSDPNLKQQVEKSQQIFRQTWRGGAKNYDPNGLLNRMGLKTNTQNQSVAS